MAHQAKDWVFTVNNYTIEDRNTIIDKFKHATTYYVIGRETSKTGTNHLQGFAQFKKKKRLTALKKFFRKYTGKKDAEHRNKPLTIAKKNNYI